MFDALWQNLRSLDAEAMRRFMNQCGKIVKDLGGGSHGKTQAWCCEN
jgi:hypothetical protein